MTVFSWFFERKTAKSEPEPIGADLNRRIRDLEETMEHLSADMDWLKADQAKLRGRLTGGVRKTAEDAPGQAIPAEGAPRFSPAWWKAQGVNRGVG